MRLRVNFVLLCTAFVISAIDGFTQTNVLDQQPFKKYIDAFNQNDNELYKQEISNDESWEFLTKNIPFFECPDKQLEQTYYFRWWTYRKHLKKTPEGYVITEFLPTVPWAGKNNTISCPAGHHFYEGRWLHNDTYLKDYARFWFRGGGSPGAYSFWASDAISAFEKVHPDSGFISDLFPDLVKNYRQWENTNLDSTGLFWQVDDRDGMEVSVSGAMGKGGQGYRATINSYMFGDAEALQNIAVKVGNKALEKEFKIKSENIRRQILEKLWDENAGFFKVIPRGNKNFVKADVRELHGFTPWYFSIPEKKHAIAWAQIKDEKGFAAQYGLTSTEQRDPRFTVSYEGHECQWNGPSWPFATSITLTAMANLLNNDDQQVIGKTDFLNALTTYSRAHQRTLENGKVVPWIDENLNPFTGDWISRTRLSKWENGSWSQGKGGEERGKDYNHSTFCDQIISGLIGIRASDDGKLIINPLITAGVWEYFCLDNVLYRNKIVSVFYDKTGKKYGKGKGFKVFVNGKETAASSEPSKVVINI